MMTFELAEQAATRAMEHLRVLVDDIGERPLGSAAHHQAEDYLRQAFTTAGYAIDAQRYDCPDWICTKAKLILHGQRLRLEANPFSPACAVTAPTVALGTLAQLDQADLDGKIAVLYGDLAQTWIFPIGFTIYNPERDQTINRLLIEKAPLAVLVTKPKPGQRIHIFEDWDLPLPSATVETSDAFMLLRQAGEPVTVKLETTSQPSYGHTLIARWPDTGQGGDRVVLMAHHDTKFGTPGAYDNGAGTAAMLALAEAYAGRDFPVPLEFIAWGDEEYGGQSDGIYAEAAGDSLRDIRLAINFDSVGHVAGTNKVSPMAVSTPLADFVSAEVDDFPGMLVGEPWYASNHSTFALRGVPSLAFTATLPDIWHQPLDTLRGIVPEKLAEAIAVNERILDGVMTQPPAWTRPDNDD